MKSADDFVAEIDEEITELEAQITRLRAMREAASDGWLKPARANPGHSGEPSDPVPRRARRTAVQMRQITDRITELHRESPERTPAEHWRQMILEKLLNDTSHDRDTVSRQIRKIRKIEDDEARDRELGVMYLTDNAPGGA